MAESGPLLMGIDAGTSSLRALVFTLEGRQLAEGRAPTPIEVAPDGVSSFDPDTMWQAMAGAIRAAVDRIDHPDRIAGVAVASIGESGVALDGDLKPVARSLAWYDQSPQPIAARLDAQLGGNEVHMAGGMRLHPIASLCKMAWLQDQDPTAFGRMRHWVNVSDFIAMRLSGVIATDYSLAGRTGCLDLAADRWNAALMAEAGLDAATLPPLATGGTALGKVTADAAAQTGLPESCIVAMGGHDHIVGALAAGIFASGEMLDSIGTAEALLLPIPGRTDDPRFVEWGLEQAQIKVGDQGWFFICGSLATASASVEWFRKLFHESADYDAMMAAAAAVAPGAEGVVFLPHLRIGSPPDCHASPAGAYFGLSSETDQAVLYRALLEGLALDTRSIRDHMVALLPDAERRAALARPIAAIGGSAQNRLLMDIKAAAYGAPIRHLTDTEAVSRGAALLAGLGSGIFSDFATASAANVLASETIAPDPELGAAYETIFSTRFKPALAATRTWRLAAHAGT